MALAWRNRADIIQIIEQYSDDLGEDIGKMLQSWRCIGTDHKQSELIRSLYRSHKPSFEDDTDRTLWNGLAWFAAEEVARWFCD
jgi:hypothetical protein